MHDNKYGNLKSKNMLDILFKRIHLLGFSILFMLVGCNNEDLVTKNHIDGTFKCFEGELDGEIFELPIDGFSLEIKIESVNDQEAMVEVIPYGDGNPIDFPSQRCNLKTDADGYLNLISKKDGSMYVIFYDRETIDCYPGNGTRLSGSRNGKKPKWWD
ncbi:hypothetical protein GCM10007415_25620 [Parapedobacter pyrenivorans]|uniref:Uncharacterized protein n=1 Tax=Parapedobacter pyrenivorans TaxID=1305674 RepID=A0A917MBR8_9SPHI|nr:hypothetical protein [Parapedobacter pyrenivorans]GGG90099.1 hypothetical protein GCM10007415_25620 [Parapedobacter pyrenivorans]